MFPRLCRLPIRRFLHTPSATRNSGSLRRATHAVLGASAVTAVYMTWRLTHESNQIALDSVPAANSLNQKPLTKSAHKESHPPERLSESQSEFALNTSAPSSSSTDENLEGDEKIEPVPEAEGSQGGAFNPVTGEINWDCPCLGGMAYGPCGQEFREAFSCFVYSDAEPKGINCVEKFQNMQNCFRAHPEVYADEIMDEEEEAPTTAESSNISLHGQSNDSNLEGQNSSDVSTAQKSRIETPHSASDSS